ncbi:MAG TPA: ABC transporter substrate-binding protein [Chloroflexota bacterium]|jgi:ABC-type glycerol-3-phosphate transport system substrate-binding protein
MPITRRKLVLVLGGTAATAILAACGGAASPTAAPAAKPTEAPKPAGAAPAQGSPAAPAAAPTTAAAATKPAAAATKPAAGATTAPAAGGATAAAKPAEAPKPGAAAGDVLFWHTQTGPLADALNKIIDDFNKKSSGAKIKGEYAGSYTQTYQKAMAAIQGGGLPSMAVAYESMVADYMRANAVVALDDYVGDGQNGLSKADLDDIFPFALSRNRFPQFGNKLLSFPFTVSNLNMYTNVDMLKQAGVNAVPQTWDDFYAASKAIKEKLNKPAYTASVDASTIHGMIYSNGGNLLDESNTKTLYDQKPGVDTFELLERMAKEGLVFQIKPGSNDDQNDIANEKAAFMIRSSTTRPFLEPLVKDKFKWTMSLIPQGKENKEKATTLFGANVTIFKSTPEKQLGAWQFIKYFASTDVTSEWGAVGGYIPVRKSGANVDPYKSYLAKNPELNRVSLDNMQYSRPEPNIIGYQDIRPVIEDAETAVLAGKSTGQQAAKKVKDEADKILAEKKL